MRETDISKRPPALDCKKPFRTLDIELRRSTQKYNKKCLQGSHLFTRTRQFQVVNLAQCWMTPLSEAKIQALEQICNTATNQNLTMPQTIRLACDSLFNEVIEPCSEVEQSTTFSRSWEKQIEHSKPLSHPSEYWSRKSSAF